jgi:hypothetical protein
MINVLRKSAKSIFILSTGALKVTAQYSSGINFNSEKNHLDSYCSSLKFSVLCLKHTKYSSIVFNVY